MNISYQCMAAVQWVVEAGSIVLVNRESGATCSLEYPQAAIWDLMTRDYLYEQMLPMLSAITGLDKKNVHAILVESLKDWERNGFSLKTEEIQEC